jgi:trehalose-6-phosphate synthase
VKIDKEFEKVKRLNTLKRLLKRHPEEIGKKSTIDIVEQMRVEVEGNKLEHTGEIKVVKMNDVTVGNRILEFDIG